MKLTPRQRQIWRRLAGARHATFAELVEIAALDPAQDFRGADLAGVDFGEVDLRAFDFEGADLRAADLSRANVRIASLRGAQMDGARLPMRLDLTPDQIRVILAILAHLREGRTRAMVSVGAGGGATRIASELVREILEQNAQAMPLVVSFAAHETKPVVEALRRVGVSAAPLADLQVGARAMRAYVSDYATALRAATDPSSPSRGMLRNGGFTHLICLSANHAPGKVLRALLDQAQSLTQVAFVAGTTHERSVLQRHFRGDEVPVDAYLDPDAVDAAISPRLRLIDCRGRLQLGAAADRAKRMPVENAMADFMQRLAVEDLLQERSLVLCPTRAEAQRAAQTLNSLYRTARVAPDPDRETHDPADVPNSREHAAYLLGRRRGPPFVICCTSQALGSAPLDVSAVAVLVRSPGLHTPHILEMIERPGASKPVLVFDYAGAAVRSSAKISRGRRRPGPD